MRSLNQGIPENSCPYTIKNRRNGKAFAGIGKTEYAVSFDTRYEGTTAQPIRNHKSKVLSKERFCDQLRRIRNFVQYTDFNLAIEQ